MRGEWQVSIVETKTKLAQGLGKRLLLWSISSSVVGIMLYFTSIPLIQGIGLQAMLWGVIDLVIAVFTLRKNNEQPIEKLANILRINTGLDIVYQIIGILLLVFFWQNPFVAGNGIGVIIQGAFLFVLDLYYWIRFRALLLSD